MTARLTYDIPPGFSKVRNGTVRPEERHRASGVPV